MNFQRGFGERLGLAMADLGPLCVGIDPHEPLLREWGLPVSAKGAKEMGLRVIEACAGVAACVKPQAGFFEPYGSAGVAALEAVIAAAREADLLCIVDAKRGDIGSTMHGYAQAYLGPASPLAADAVTLSPYLGFGSLLPALQAAEAARKGVFVLCLTSNPEGAGVQHSRTASGTSVAGTILTESAAANAQARSQGALGDVGLVVGATIGDAAATLGLDFSMLNGPILTPGIGAQGGTPDAVRKVFGKGALRQVLASSSRGVLRHGPDIKALRAAAAQQAGEFSWMQD